MHTLRYYIDLINESELIEPEVNTKQIDHLDVGKLQKFKDKKMKNDDPNSGYFAHSKSINPHEIKLTDFEPSKKQDDPRIAYFEKIKELQGGNPFVPTIYEINIIKAKNLPGSQKSSYRMQKLLSWGEVPTLSLFQTCIQILETLSGMEYLIDEFKTIYKKLHSEIMYSDKKDLTQKFGAFDKKPTENWDLELYDEKLNCVIKTAMYLKMLFNQYITTNDDNLEEIMQIIREVMFENTNFTYDLHANNFMFRPTSNAYQLVITDPIATMRWTS